MSRKVKVSLSASGIQTLRDATKDFQRSIKKNAVKFVDRLASEAQEIASSEFTTARYDGTNDVTVHTEERDKYTRAVVASGEATLFIEFGTGVSWPNDHPQAGELGMSHGTYGAGHGKWRSWGYYGDPGTDGVVATNRQGREVVITTGNPANAPMYLTTVEIEDRAAKVAREVFESD